MSDALNGHDTHGDGPFSDADQLQQYPTIKDGHTRLLDLLAGWSQFLLEESAVPDLLDYDEAVRDLYHIADSTGEHRTDEGIRLFINEQVVPLLLRRS